MGNVSCWTMSETNWCRITRTEYTGGIYIYRPKECKIYLLLFRIMPNIMIHILTTLFIKTCAVVPVVFGLLYTFQL